MSLFRKTVSDISKAEMTLPSLFMDPHLSFVTYIASHRGGGNSIVGAGPVPLLVQIIGITHEQRPSIVSKAVQLIDNVLYGYTVALTMLCNNRDVETLTDRIKVRALVIDWWSFFVLSNPACSLKLIKLLNSGSDAATRSAANSHGTCNDTPTI